MGKKFLASVANIEYFAKKDKELVHFASAKTLTDSALGFTLSMEEVRAGQGGKLYGRFAHTSGMTLQATDALFDIKYLKAILGAEMGANGEAHSVLKTETLKLQEGYTVHLTHKAQSLSTLCGAKDKIAWARPSGCDASDNDVTLTINASDDQTATIGEDDRSGFKIGDDVCVTYFIDNPSSTLMKIKAKFIPAELVAIMSVQEFAGDANAPETGKPVGTLMVKIPRLQLDGQFDLTLNMTSSAPINLNGTALAVSDGGCDGDDYYAEIIDVFKDPDFWIDGLRELGIDEATAVEGTSAVVYGYYKDGEIRDLSSIIATSTTTYPALVGPTTLTAAGGLNVWNAMAASNIIIATATATSLSAE